MYKAININLYENYSDYIITMYCIKGVNYNFSGKPPYFPVTCLPYNNFIGSIPLQLYRKWFLSYNISGKLPENLVVDTPFIQRTSPSKQ